MADDSLYLEIENSYHVNITKKYNGSEKELIYAMDLLERNNLMPGKPFVLEFTIKNYYTKAMVPQLIFDYDSEITRFDLNVGDTV